MPGRLFRQLEMCMIKWGTIRSVVLLYGGACRLRGEKGGGGFALQVSIFSVQYQPLHIPMTLASFCIWY